MIRLLRPSVCQEKPNEEVSYAIVPTTVMPMSAPYLAGFGWPAGTLTELSSVAWRTCSAYNPITVVPVEFAECTS